MKGIFKERNIVVILFIMVLVTFSMAQNETKKIEQLYNGGQSSLKNFPTLRPEARAQAIPQSLIESEQVELILVDHLHQSR